jgi:hypothetical protein
MIILMKEGLGERIEMSIDGENLIRVIERPCLNIEIGSGFKRSMKNPRKRYCLFRGA